MSIDFTKPIATADRAQNLTDTKDNAVALAKMLEDASPTGATPGFKRWSATNKRLEQYNGTSWDQLVDEMAQLVKEPLVTVAAAATVDLGAQKGRTVIVTGTTGITSFGVAPEGVLRVVRFASQLTLTHNATSLILPGAGDVITAAGDCLVAVSLGAGNWFIAQYQRAASPPLVITSSSSAYGTWLPTMVSYLNCTAATWKSGHYSRIGNFVTVAGRFEFTVTTGGSKTEVLIGLPVNSAMNTGSHRKVHGYFAIGARDANEFPDTLGEIDGVNLSGSNYLWARSIPAVSGWRVGRFIAQYEVI